jgi:hypothetical protein
MDLNKIVTAKRHDHYALVQSCIQQVLLLYQSSHVCLAFELSSMWGTSSKAGSVVPDPNNHIYYSHQAEIGYHTNTA